MNDMAYLCEDAVAQAGGLALADVPVLNRSLHRNINSARELPAADRPRHRADSPITGARG